MDALIASYGDSSAESDSEESSSSSVSLSLPPKNSQPSPLPPPPISLLTPRNSLPGNFDYSETGQPSRVRSFPHVEGNYALHVFIPVHVPPQARKEVAQFLKRITFNVPGLHVVDVDIPLDHLHSDDQKLEHIALGREFHISLGRTVPIRVHQIDSVVTMLRQKLHLQKCYWIDFSNWEVFVNDDGTRTFLSMEVITGGLPEADDLNSVLWQPLAFYSKMGIDYHSVLTCQIPTYQGFTVPAMQKCSDLLPAPEFLHQCTNPVDFHPWEKVVHDQCSSNYVWDDIRKQIQAVNEVYRLHNLPEFYKDPRPHISLAWAVGDVSDLLHRTVADEVKMHPNGGGSLQRRVFTVKFSGIDCKIGNKTYKICKVADD